MTSQKPPLPGPPLPEPPLPGPGDALFLDFDGTLTALRDDPDAVWLPDGGAAVLTALSGKLGGALAVISGRGIVDLAKRAPAGLWRIGGHGLDICAPGEDPAGAAHAAPALLVNALKRLAADTSGARLEEKGGVLALHYRAAPEAGEALAAAMTEILRDIDGYRLQSGKMVLEAKPFGAHKGRALAAMMENPPFAGRTPVMVGDDATDEDAIAFAIDAGGEGVKVGPGESRARFRLSGPADVWRWLEAAAS
ncbi:trehalose-phosphatase [Hyphococcus luteus]|uniref:Trehalose 6-phosphate phosphatase n=1 Tax=Hyphococcus luteus TaxID=2058213 RepID=A0A2S7K015_9PROT|nr:trehalose-phosphatase [Marinicaulis flavus]PQA85811.1 trehalose-phosphatase [Marinicaulis flavus]